MTLYGTITADCATALKHKDTIKVSVLRMVIAAAQMLEIQKNLKAVDDADMLQILQKQVKQRRESIDQFTKGNRPDLADRESAELKILEGYLPRQLSEEELADTVKAVIAETGAAAKADTGKVMKAVMEKVKGRADGKTVSRIVSSLLP